MVKSGGSLRDGSSCVMDGGGSLVLSFLDVGPAAAAHHRPRPYLDGTREDDQIVPDLLNSAPSTSPGGQGSPLVGDILAGHQDYLGHQASHLGTPGGPYSHSPNIQSHSQAQEFPIHYSPAQAQEVSPHTLSTYF